MCVRVCVGGVGRGVGCRGGGVGHREASHGVVWSGVEWCGVVWSGVEWCACVK